MEQQNVEIAQPTVLEDAQAIPVPEQVVEQTEDISETENIEITQDIENNNEEELNNEVQSFEYNTTEEIQQEEDSEVTEPEEEIPEPVIVAEEPAELAPANINDPIIEKRAVDNSPLLPENELPTIPDTQVTTPIEKPLYKEEPKQSTKFCDDCGTMITDGGVICPECGSPIR